MPTKIHPDQRHDPALILALVQLSIGIMLVIARPYGEVVLHLWPNQPTPTNYLMVLGYCYTAMPIALMFILITVFLAIIWRRSAAERRRTTLIALMISAAALVCVLVSALPLLAQSYTHLDSYMFAEQRYHVGEYDVIDEQNTLIVTRCNIWNTSCMSYKVSAANIAQATLAYDQASNTLVVQTPQEQIPLPQPMSPLR